MVKGREEGGRMGEGLCREGKSGGGGDRDCKNHVTIDIFIISLPCNYFFSNMYVI